MRRKSERNKSKPAEKKSEPSPKKSRRSSRRRKRSSSRSSSEDSDDVPLKATVVEVVEPEVSPPSDEQKKPESHSNSDEDKQEQPIWKVKTTEAPSGEIQKLKICLQRPSTTPERTEKSPRRRRGQASSQSDDASVTSDERPHGRKKNRRSSPYSSAAEGSSLDNTAIEAAEKEETITVNTETNEVEIGQGKLDRSQKDQESENADCVQDSRSEECKNESLKQSETEDAVETAGEQNIKTNKEESPEVEIVSEVAETEKNVEKDRSLETEEQKEKHVEESEVKEKEHSAIVLQKDEESEKNEVTEKEQTNTSPDIKEQNAENDVKEEKMEQIIEQVSDKSEAQKITPSLDTQPETEITEDNEIQEAIVFPETNSTKNQLESLVKAETQDSNVSIEENSSNKIRSNSPGKSEDPETTGSPDESLAANKDESTEKMSIQKDCKRSNEKEKSSELAIKSEVVPESNTEKDKVNNTALDSSTLNADVKMNFMSETLETTGTLADTTMEVGESSINDSKNESTDVKTEKSSENDTSVDSKPESPETLPKVEQVEECITAAPFVRPECKRKWGKYKVTLKEEDRITSESIKSFMPSFKFLAEEKLKLEPEEIKEHKIPKRDREVTIHLPAPPKHEDDSEREFSTIGLNRKISIVNDEASKLQPPPSPAKNTTSAILYITNLVRPFTLKQLQELLSRTGKIVDDGFWTDKIKSRCYVQYETEEEAEATRNALHGVQWPTGNGKKLVIDFGTAKVMAAARKVIVEEPAPPKEIPEKVAEKVPEFEKKDVVTNNDRWDKARAAAPVREWDLGKVPQDQREKERERSRSKDRGHPDKDRNRPDKRRPGRNESPSNGDHISARKRKKEENEVKLMDDLFHKTKATPSIYWLPLSPDQIAKKQQQRLQRMAEHKRRMEESRRTDRDRDFGRGQGQGRNRRRPNRYDGD